MPPQTKIPASAKRTLRNKVTGPGHPGRTEVALAAEKHRRQKQARSLSQQNLTDRPTDLWWETEMANTRQEIIKYSSDTWSESRAKGGRT